MDKEKSKEVQGIDKYLEERLQSQQSWFEAKAGWNKRRFMRYQTTIIVLGALIPLIVVFFSMLPVLEGWTGPTSAAISAVIAVFAGVDKLTQPQTNWFNYRKSEEMLKKEEWMYLYKAGPYKNPSEGEAEKLLVERAESIISSDIDTFTQKEGES